MALTHAYTLGDIDGKRLTDASQSKQKKLKAANVVVLQAVVLNVVLSPENELTIVAINDVFRTRFIVVLPNFTPSCQIFGAVGTVVMFELMCVVASIRHVLLAVSAFNGQTVEQILGHSADFLESIGHTTVFIRAVHRFGLALRRIGASFTTTDVTG